MVLFVFTTSSVTNNNSNPSNKLQFKHTGKPHCANSMLLSLLPRKLFTMMQQQTRYKVSSDVPIGSWENLEPMLHRRYNKCSRAFSASSLDFCEKKTKATTHAEKELFVLLFLVFDLLLLLFGIIITIIINFLLFCCRYCCCCCSSCCYCCCCCVVVIDIVVVLMLLMLLFLLLCCCF